MPSAFTAEMCMGIRFYTAGKGSSTFLPTAVQGGGAFWCIKLYMVWRQWNRLFPPSSSLSQNTKTQGHPVELNVERFRTGKRICFFANAVQHFIFLLSVSLPAPPLLNPPLFLHKTTGHFYALLEQLFFLDLHLCLSSLWFVHISEGELWNPPAEVTKQTMVLEIGRLPSESETGSTLAFSSSLLNPFT